MKTILFIALSGFFIGIVCAQQTFSNVATQDGQNISVTVNRTYSVDSLNADCQTLMNKITEACGLYNQAMQAVNAYEAKQNATMNGVTP